MEDEVLFEDVIFGVTDNLRTKAAVVSCNNLRQVDNAVRKLTERHVLGVEIFYDSPNVAQDGAEYNPISALCISNGDFTVVFHTNIEELPMALSLLFTHQDYIKIGFNTRHDKVGRMHRDWNSVPTPLHDVDDVLYSTVDANNFNDAVKSVLPGCNFKVDPAIIHGRWSNRLTNGQANVAAFYGWGIRRMWLDLANPQGFPPVAKTQPVKLEPLLTGVNCAHCGKRFHSKNALGYHEENEHRHPCDHCGEVFHNLDDFMEHQRQEHVQCTACGTWVADEHMLMVHAHKYHEIRCLAGGCGQIFDDKESRQLHMQTQHVKCQDCGAWFLTDGDWQLHRDVVHPSCELCGRVFKTAKELQKHTYARVNGICYDKSTGRERGVGRERVDGPNAASTPMNQSMNSQLGKTNPTNTKGNRVIPNESLRSTNGTRPVTKSSTRTIRKTSLTRTNIKPNTSGVGLLSRTPHVTSSRTIEASPRHRGVFSSRAQSHRVDADEIESLQQTTMFPQRDSEDYDDGSGYEDEEEGNMSYLELNTSRQREVIHHSPPSKVDERDEGWVPPPYHMPVPLKLAPSADTVGLYG